MSIDIYTFGGAYVCSLCEYGDKSNAEINGIVAGILSTIDVCPSGEHPETMLPVAQLVVATVQDYHAARRQVEQRAMDPDAVDIHPDDFPFHASRLVVDERPDGRFYRCVCDSCGWKGLWRRMASSASSDGAEHEQMAADSEPRCVR